MRATLGTEDRGCPDDDRNEQRDHEPHGHRLFQLYRRRPFLLMSRRSLKERQLPYVGRHVVAKDAEFSGGGSYSEVTVIGREPLVDHQFDFKRAFAEAKPAWCLLTTISSVAVHRYAQQDFVRHQRDHTSARLTKCRYLRILISA